MVINIGKTNQVTFELMDNTKIIGFGDIFQMVELTHNNLNVFIGACLDAPHVCVLWEYCSKGSLQDVIGNDHINLEEMFKFSVLIDILKACMI